MQEISKSFTSFKKKLEEDILMAKTERDNAQHRAESAEKEILALK